MYVWLFRQLPGPLWLRIVLSVLLLAGVLFLLVEFLFPWLSEATHLTDVTVGVSLLGAAVPGVEVPGAGLAG